MRITSGDAGAAPDEQLGQGAHAGTGDPHEMDRAIVGRVDERHESARLNIGAPWQPLKTEIT